MKFTRPLKDFATSAVSCDSVAPLPVGGPGLNQQKRAALSATTDSKNIVDDIGAAPELHITPEYKLAEDAFGLERD